MAKLFVDADCAAGHAAIIHIAVHFLVDGHKVSLKHLDELERYNQGDRDEGRIKDKVRAESNAGLSCAVDVLFCDVDHEVVVRGAFKIAEEGACETAEQLEEKHNEDDAVDLIFD